MSSNLIDQISSDLERFGAAWETNDGDVVGSFFVPEGSIVNPFGDRADGQSAVSAMYSAFFGAMLRDTKTTIKVANVRALGADLAFTDCDQVIYGADGSVVLACHLAALMRREGGSWRFVDARPYTTPTPG